MTRFEPCLQIKNKAFESVDSAINFFCSNGHTTTTSFVCSLTQPPNNKQHTLDSAGKIEWDKMKLEDRAQSSMTTQMTSAQITHSLSLSPRFLHFPWQKDETCFSFPTEGICLEETQLHSSTKFSNLITKTRARTTANLLHVC